MPSESPSPECPRCRKPEALCVCAGIEPIASRVKLLVLQHPQEQDKLLGTARLAALHFKDSTFRIGLSWPSLAAALGREAAPRRWAVLYLGSAKAEGGEVVALDRKGVVLADQRAALGEIAGVVLLDGSWSQAKTLWWRNPWLLKCQRVVLGPARPSRYGRLRREARPDALSTLEAAALLLSRLEAQPGIETQLLASFERLLERYRASGSGRI